MITESELRKQQSETNVSTKTEENKPLVEKLKQALGIQSTLSSDVAAGETAA